MTDVVVVGAGSAGAAVAARLSADPARRVLLLEAGPVPPAGATPAGVRSPDFTESWTEPGRLWPDLRARRTAGQPPRLYRRGRGLGGSSAVNALAALWPPAADFDAWAAGGAAGWTWTGVAGAVRRVEAAVPCRPPGPPGPVGAALTEAAAAHGHRVTADHTTVLADGVGPLRLTWDGAHRVSTDMAYLDPARSRPNLVVRGDALVDRVLFDGGDVAGVRLAGGEEVTAPAVVLCAGAIHSPAVLLRSGVDRPGVGAGLQDHPSAVLVLDLRPEARTTPGSRPVVTTALRCSSGEVDADLQVLALDAVGPGSEGHRWGALMVALMHVVSRGRVTLAAADPLVDPVVDLALLSDPADRRRLRVGVRHLAVLAAHPAVAAVAERVLIDDAGTPVDDLPGDDDGLDGWLAAHLGDYVHACGTCRMGAADDPRAVVDPGLQVIGRAGLWVADASVLPTVPRANTHLAAVLVGERGADLVAAALAG